MPKTSSPLSASEFSSSAAPLDIGIQGQHLLGSPKEFSTGSFGWYASGKVVITVDGRPLTVQAGITLTVVGSKDAPR